MAKPVKKSIQKAPKKGAKKTASKAPANSKKAPKTLKTIARSFKAKLTRGVRGRVVRALVESFLPTASPSPDTHPAAPESGGSPRYYCQDTMVLMARDPWWLFVYWEVTDRRRQEVYDLIQRAGQHPQSTLLRVYDITESGQVSAAPFFEIEIGFSADNWYVDVGRPDREWIVELGVRTREGSFFAWVRSNPMRTPRYGLSDVLDEEWLLPDEAYWKIIGYSAGAGKGKSSEDVQEILRRYLRTALSSENLSKKGDGAISTKAVPKI